MATISDLPFDLVEEILKRVPITCVGAVSSTCKRWNTLSKSQILCKAEAKDPYIGFMIKNSKLCSLRFDIHEEFAVKEISDSFNQAEICEVLVCDGLLLCVTQTRNHIQRLMLWNPYLGQTRWIRPRIRAFDRSDVYALGYDKCTNRNHKILRYNYSPGEEVCEIYDVKSDSWRTLDVALHWGWGVEYGHFSASLKGNTYFLDFCGDDEMFSGFLLCFDFTTERFGEQLHLPWSQGPRFYDRVTPISCFREEKLAALYICNPIHGMGIWVTTKTEPDELLWSNLFKINLETLPCDESFGDGSFFIDEEKKRVVVFSYGCATNTMSEEEDLYNAAYIIGENDFFRIVDLGGTNNTYYCPDVCSNSYVPSLVQIKQKEREEEEAALV